MIFISILIGHAEVPPQPNIDDPPARQPLTAAQLALNGLGPPVVTNTGHDFVAMNWTTRPGTPVGHHIFTSRWGPSFVARHAPDWSGMYSIDGEDFEVCTRRNGILGEGRMAVFLKSEEGGFLAFGTGK